MDGWGSDLLAAFVGFEPRRVAPIPLPGLERFNVAVGKGHVASAVVPQERAAPIPVRRIDATSAGGAVNGVMHNPAFGFFFRIYGDAFFGVLGFERSASAVG